MAFPVYNGIAYWTAMPVKVDENYYFSAHYGGQRHGIKLYLSATIFAL